MVTTLLALSKQIGRMDVSQLDELCYCIFDRFGDRILSFLADLIELIEPSVFLPDCAVFEVKQEYYGYEEKEA